MGTASAFVHAYIGCGIGWSECTCNLNSSDAESGGGFKALPPTACCRCPSHAAPEPGKPRSSRLDGGCRSHRAHNAGLQGHATAGRADPSGQPAERGSAAPRSPSLACAGFDAPGPARRRSWGTHKPLDTRRRPPAGADRSGGQPQHTYLSRVRGRSSRPSDVAARSRPCTLPDPCGRRPSGRLGFHL